MRESRCVVFTGGARAFSAGADVTEFRDADAASVLAYYAGTGGVYERIARLPQPTLAAISGYCLGGGLELALATDIRVADATATFGLPEVGLGIIPSSGGVLRLTRAVGPARAKELILRGRRFEGGEAYVIGLVSVLAEGDALHAGARDRARAGGVAAAGAADGQGDGRPGGRVVPRGGRADGAARPTACWPQTPAAQDAATAFTEKRGQTPNGGCDTSVPETFGD